MQRRQMGACAVCCALCPLCRLCLCSFTVHCVLCSVPPAHLHLPALRALADVPLVHLHCAI